MADDKATEKKPGELNLNELTLKEPHNVSKKKKPWDGVDRREKPKNKDAVYRFAMVGNVLAWLAFVASMVIFHFARPEQETGMHRFWGVEVRTEWHADYLPSLLILLASCTLLSLVAMILRRRRSRRKQDSFAFNIFLLTVVASAGLVWVYKVFLQVSAV
ncbi:MAG: hypothetical protein ACFHVJ_11380 [Aestuariibacter sp.]